MSSSACGSSSPLSFTMDGEDVTEVYFLDSDHEAAARRVVITQTGQVKAVEAVSGKRDGGRSVAVVFMKFMFGQKRTGQDGKEDIYCCLARRERGWAPSDASVAFRGQTGVCAAADCELSMAKDCP